MDLQEKEEIAQNNITFILKDIEVLLTNSLKRVIVDKWKNCIDHVIKEETEMWELDNLIDQTIELIIIIIGAEDNSSKYSD